MSIIGIDIGGTSITLALTDKTGIIVEKSMPTLSEEGHEDVIARLLLNIRQLMHQAAQMKRQIIAVGVACPGIIAPHRRMVVYSPNLNWRDVPLPYMLEQQLGLPVFMENDANLYALGEYVYGQGQAKRDLICITLGTGVGSGIVCNGQILIGQSGWSAELGHTIVQAGGRRCGCGSLGCLEAYASATGLQGMLAEALNQGAKSTMLKPGDGVKIMDEAARQGDALAMEIFNQAGAYLGLGIVNVVLTTGIETIVVGGGVAKGWDLLHQACWQQIQQSLKIIDWKHIVIEPSRLEQNAPLLGATAMAYEQLKEHNKR